MFAPSTVTLEAKPPSITSFAPRSPIHMSEPPLLFATHTLALFSAVMERLVTDAPELIRMEPPFPISMLRPLVLDWNSMYALCGAPAR